MEDFLFCFTIPISNVDFSYYFLLLRAQWFVLVQVDFASPFYCSEYASKCHSLSKRSELPATYFPILKFIFTFDFSHSFLVDRPLYIQTLSWVLFGVQVPGDMVGLLAIFVELFSLCYEFSDHAAKGNPNT